MQVMLKTWNGGKPTPEFNNAAQVVNHTFFWESMSPNGGGEPAPHRMPTLTCSKSAAISGRVRDRLAMPQASRAWHEVALQCAGKPTGAVAEAIDKDLGGYDKFVEAFKAAGATQFGSGWAWLSVNKEGKLEVTKTPNAENPWVHGATPILTMDVW
jgi:Fe-Mn family superoxide dismutase